MLYIADQYLLPLRLAAWSQETDIYQAFWGDRNRIFNSHDIPFSPKNFQIDYEIGAKTAMETVYPDAAVKGK